MIRFRIIGTVVVLGCCLLYSSCKKSELKGLSVQPKGEQLEVNLTDTITLSMTNVLSDHIRSDETLINLVGRYVDPVFGEQSASLHTQIYKSKQTVDFGNLNTVVIDSVILAMAYSNYYGNLTKQSFVVHEVSQSLSPDSNFYSDANITVYEQQVGALYDEVPKIFDGVTVGEITELPQLRIPLTQTFGKRLMELASQTTDQEAFIGILQGLRISPAYTRISPNGTGLETKETPIYMNKDEGAVIAVDLLSETSRVTIYYHQPGEAGQSYDFDIISGCGRVGTFAQKYAGTVVQSNIDAGGNETGNFYVQAMGGVRVKLEFPYLQTLAENGNLPINKAELVFPVSNGTTDSYDPLEQFALVVIKEDESLTNIVDLFETFGHFDGRYNGEDGAYHINITRHIQSLISDYSEGKNSNFGLYLQAAGSAINSKRTVLNGHKSSENNARIEITYTNITNY